MTTTDSNETRMKEDRKTTTLLIDHDACKMRSWTIADFKTLADFVARPTMQAAAALARRGIHMKLSEHFEERGGDIEHIGWTSSDADGDLMPRDTLAELIADEADTLEVIPVCEVFHGPVRYAVGYRAGDDDYGTDLEAEVFDTEEKANAFLASIEAEIARNEKAKA